VTKGLQRSLSRGPATRQSISKLEFSVNAPITSVATGSAIGFGSAVIGDFPEGNILLLGAIANLNFTGPTSDDLTDTWAGDFGIGTTPASDATISVADEDIIPETAIPPATAEASPVVRAPSTANGVILDNTDGSLEINLNLLVDAANQTDDTSVVITATGSVVISFVVLGDD